MSEIPTLLDGRPREYELQNYNRPVEVFYGRDGLSRDYLLNPAYQRGSVWTDEQRRNLVLSMIQGLPIGALFLNERGIAEYAVVDGKQRIETLQMWGADELSVPASWFGLAGGEDVERGELPDNLRRRSDNFPVATYQTRFKGSAAEIEAQEIELFNRVNFGGTPHEARGGMRTPLWSQS